MKRFNSIQLFILTLVLGLTLGAFAKEQAVHHEVSKSVVPEKAWGWLKNGNKRFLKHSLRKDGQGIDDIHRLSEGQKPHSIILSCSDSRVPPEVVFDQKLGEIFVIRTAGEAIDYSATASIEYALEHLGTKLIVVMGHTSCGAVTAAMSTLNGGDAGSESLNKLVGDIHPRLLAFKSTAPSANVEKESWANAKGVAEDLIKRSKIVAEKIKSGDAMIKVGLYYLDRGEVKWDE